MGIFHRLLWGSGTEEYWHHRDQALAARSRLIRRYHRWRYCRIMYRHGASIPDAVQIQGHLILPHGLAGVFISQGAVIGQNCTVFQQVTIGSNTVPGSKGFGSPVIGDNVYIGAGAKIIGNVTIGNNVRIGANCVVTHDVPDNATVVLPAPRVIIRPDSGDNTFHKFE